MIYIYTSVVAYASFVSLNLFLLQTGLLRLPDDDYLIEPMSVYVPLLGQRSGSNNSEHPAPHVIYKRSTIAAHEPRHYEGKDCKYKCKKVIFQIDTEDLLVQNHVHMAALVANWTDDRTISSGY